METLGGYLESLGGFEEARPPPPGDVALRPSTEVRNAVYTLMYDGEFAGTALAIGPRLVITAGHHFKVTGGDCGKLTLHSASAEFQQSRKLRRSSAPVAVSYVQKDRRRDLLLVWPDEDLYFVNVFAHMPVVGARVVTVYAPPKPPHMDLAVSPGVIYDASPKLCRSHGTVTTQGASGAPVLDSYGERVVGIHLSVSDSAADGSWVSEFVPSRELIGMLIDANVDPSVPYRVEDEEKQSVASPKKTDNKKTNSSSNSKGSSKTTKKVVATAKKGAKQAKSTTAGKPKSSKAPQSTAKKTTAEAKTKKAAGGPKSVKKPTAKKQTSKKK